MIDYDKLYKYPKIWHLPWSPGLQNDDRLLKSTESFIDKEVVVTVKMDGENSNLYNHHYHVRSLDTGYHESRTWVKKLHGEICYLLKDNERICGENVAAVHSIKYKNLSNFFYMFSYWIDDVCQDWDSTVRKSNELGLERVPLLYRGPWDEKIIKSLYKETYDGNVMEGYVVRLAESFALGENNKNFQKCMAKYVRKGHVQEDEKNWLLKPVEWNEWNRS